MCVGSSFNLVSASFPPCSLHMSEALCDVGMNCIVHSWCGQELVMEACSHSWHVQPSSSMASDVEMGVGRQCVWTQRRHRSHCMRSGSAESPSPCLH